MIALRLARALLTGMAIGVTWAVTERWLQERESRHARNIYTQVMSVDA